jgi:hypothetical protein
VQQQGVQIGQRRMSSATSGHTAEWTPDPDGTGGGAWLSTKLPGRRLTRAAAAASMRLAELDACGYGGSPNAAALRAELGIREADPEMPGCALPASLREPPPGG